MDVFGIRRAVDIGRQFGNLEMPVADVECGSFAEGDAQSGHRLPRPVGIVLVQIFSSGVTDAGAEIGLEGAAAIEIVEQVRHQRPDFDVLADARIDLIGPERHFGVRAESVLEGIAQSGVGHPIVFEIELGIERLDVPVDAVANIYPSVPAFSGVRDAGRKTARTRHERGKRERPLQFFDHERSPWFSRSGPCWTDPDILLYARKSLSLNEFSEGTEWLTW